jgi:hypothetical protein
MMGISLMMNVDGHDETSTLLTLILRNDHDHRGLTATLKGRKEGHRQLRRLTSRTQDMTVTLKEAERIGLQRRSGSAMKTVSMVTTTMPTEAGRPEAQLTLRV